VGVGVGGGGGGVSTNSVEDRENGDLGAVGVLEAAVIWYKEISYHEVKSS